MFVQLETPIAFDAIDNQPVWICFSRCWFLPIRPKTHLHTLSLAAKRLGRIKPFVVDCAQPKVMLEEFYQLSLKQKAIRMEA